MRLSTIIELLLIFLIIAFGAYGRVIEPRKVNALGLKTTVVNNAAGVKRKTGSVTSFIPATLKQATDSVNKYCTCNDVICNCCRDLELPVFKLPGPGCASLQYLKNDTLVMQLSVKDNILSSNVITGKNPKPVCVAMPGGFSQFCGKIYSVKRESDDKHFKACLGLELRSSTELEASLRVSCFRFGPDGLRLRPAEPLPTSLTEATPTSDDDDFDIFGLVDDDDEEDEDEDDDDTDDQKQTDNNNAVAGSSTDEQQEQAEEEDDDDDLLGFSALLDIFTGGDETPAKKKTKTSVTTTTQATATYTIPILNPVTTTSPPTKKSVVTKKTATAATIRTSIEPVSSTQPAEINQKDSSETQDDAETDLDEHASENNENEEEDGEATTKANDDDETGEEVEETTAVTETVITEVDDETAPTNRVVPPSKAPDTKNSEKVKIKKVRAPIRKKVSLTSQSANAIKNDGVKPQHQHQNDEDDDDDDQEEYDLSDSDVEDDDDDEESDDSEETAVATHSGIHANNDKHEGNKEESDYENDDDDDEEEEAEDAMISALVGADEDDEKEGTSSVKTKKKADKVTHNQSADDHEDDPDYGYGLAELLARKQQPERTVSSARSGRQSKVMRGFETN